MILSEKFAKGAESHTYQRIDPDYNSEIYLGYNDDGNMSMVLTSYGSGENVKSSKMIDAKVAKREDGRYAMSFDLLDSTYDSMFLIFCKDMIFECEKVDKNKILTNASRRWKYWKELFGKKSDLLLGKLEVKGLIGELIHLRDYMIPKYGERDAVSSWLGPMNGHKDFEIADTWYEVKSISESSIQVNISSLEQLESDIDGHLAVYRLEDTSNTSENALSLNAIVVNVIDTIEEQEVLDLFRARLANAGYVPDQAYENYSFQKKKSSLYFVNEDFPRIRRTQISSCIGAVSYSLTTNTLSEFLEEEL